MSGCKLGEPIEIRDMEQGDLIRVHDSNGDQIGWFRYHSMASSMGDLRFVDQHGFTLMYFDPTHTYVLNNRGEPSGCPRVRVRQLDDGLPLPRYANQGDAGMDLRSRESVTLGPGERSLLYTGIALEIPRTMVALVHPRSGLANRDGVTVLNAPGTIDSGYRGEVGVILVNHSLCTQRINRGDRIAQLVFQKVEHPYFEVVEELGDTERGAGGFGSTGVA